MFKCKRDELKTRIITPALDLRITAGKVTRPPVRVTDPAFDAGKYLHTNLAATFEQARKQLKRSIA